MSAGPPYGNKNAEKWDLEKATKLFNDAIRLTRKKITVNSKLANPHNVGSFEFDFIGEIARHLGTYHKIFSHLTDRFPELRDLKVVLDNNIESNCYSNTKRGTIREATGIVNLKSNWNWTDRQELGHTLKDNEYAKMTDEEINEELKKLRSS